MGDAGLYANVSATDIVGGAQASNSLNALLTEGLQAVGASTDGWITISDLVNLNNWVRSDANRLALFTSLHGDDSATAETGFHKVQGDGATSRLFNQNFINTVADGVYHFGFATSGGRFLNEDGTPNATLSDVAAWLNNLYLGINEITGTSAADILTGSSARDVINAGAGDDTLNGDGETDFLIGGSGNDLLDGGAGADRAEGGTGNDTYYIDNPGDVVIEEAASGTDTIYSSIDYRLGATLENLRASAGSNGLILIGNELANTIVGGAGNDLIDGLAGNDTLDGGAGADAMTGGVGNDAFYVDNALDTVIETAAGGTDTVYANANWTLGAGQEIEYLRANADTVGLTLTGNELSNRLYGGAGNDSLNGGDGNDTLDGGVGTDVLAGGAGNDAFYVDNALDTVVETAAGGTDTVYASANWALGAGQEVEYLRANAGAAGLTLTGNELSNRLYGGAGNDALNGGDGNDVLDGGVGTDVLAGGAGNDAFYVDNALDTVAEAAAGGMDTVYASVDWTLGAGQEVEYLRANAGAMGLTLTGNELANQIVGAGGADALNGGDGADTLNGGAGSDALTGGAGNDTIYVDNALDTVIEAAGGGADTVYASVNWTLGAGQEVEYLRANAGATGLTLAGNELANQLYGNSGADTLDGGAGNDSLTGGGAADTFLVNVGSDLVLDLGYGGADALVVGAGATVTATVVAAWTADAATTNNGVAQINTRGLAVNLAVAGGTSGFAVTNTGGGATLTGSALDDTLIGGAGADVLDGRTGADTMNGGAGNDTFYVDTVSDIVIETMGGGADTVYTGLNWALTAGLEIETLRANAGNTGLALSGNEFANRLFGNGGADTLDGGAGNDTLDGGVGADAMTGGVGNDVFYVDNALDTVVETAAGGTDTVYASANWALGAGQEVEYLRANAGAAGLTLTGNELSNRLYGGAGNDALNGGDGNDVLDGGVGTDVLAGGAGNDAFYVDNALDTVAEAAAGGMDTVYASVDWTLGAGQEVEYLRANAGAMGLTLTGNELANQIVGAGGADALNGGDGADTLNGGAGSDALTGGAGNDTIYVDNALDTVIEAAGGGADTVYASVNWTLGAGQEVEYLRANAGATGLTLAGNELANQLYGNSGADTLDGGAGNDSLTGGGAADTFLVNVGSDLVLDLGYGGADALVVGAGATVTATVVAAWTADAATTNNGVAQINTRGLAVNLAVAGGTSGFAVTNTGGGATLTGSALDDTLIGGAGADVLDGRTGADTMNGGAGNDTFYVDTVSDIVIETMGGGADTVYTGLNWALTAGLEIETLRANAGNTGLALSGNEFANRLFGNGGADTLDGGAGNDTLDGGVGADAMTGGVGNDVFYVDNALDTVVETAAGGTDTVYASANWALGAGQEVEYLRANAGAAGLTLTGNELANSISGNTGNDNLLGRDGADVLIGDAGADILRGGVGADVITGGTEADWFVFDSAASNGIDKITDFTGGLDKLVIDATDYGLTAGATVAFVGNPSGAASGTSGMFVYNTTNHTLWWDNNGGAAGGATQIATFTSLMSPLSASDFLVVPGGSLTA